MDDAGSCEGARCTSQDAGAADVDAATATKRDAAILTSPVTPGPLEVNLQVNGGDGPCGSCAVMIAQAQGGLPPYEYVWSDDSLTGPGPHTVCPDERIKYSVEVIDDGAIESGDVQREAMRAKDSATLTCVEDEEAWGGCLVAGDGGTPDAGDSDMPVAGEVCETTQVDPTTAALFGIEETEIPVAFSSPGPELVVGKPYEISYDQLLLSINLGEPVTVQIWGAAEPCGKDQHLGELVLDGRFHQSICTIPEEPWEHIRVDIDTGNVLFYWDLITPVATVCKGCEEE